MRWPQRWVFGSLILLWVPSACASAPTAGPAAPTASLERADWLMWYGLRHFLQREDVRAAGVSAVCVALGEDGTGIPSAELLDDFVDAEPPVVSAARCSTSPEAGWTFAGTQPGPAAFLSFFDVETAGGWSMSVRVELPDQDAAVERCTFRSAPQRRRIGNANQLPGGVAQARTGSSSTLSSRPPLVSGC